MRTNTRYDYMHNKNQNNIPRPSLNANNGENINAKNIQQTNYIV
jgi:hypothetical protein